MIVLDILESMDFPVGTKIDLTKNYPKYRSLIGQVVGQRSGKLLLRIVDAIPNLGLAQIGSVLEINPVYLRRATIIA